jgi:hypothetical protein
MSIFKGLAIRYEVGYLDIVYLIDVVQRAQEPGRLIAEAARVSRVAVVVKDHLLDGFLAGTTLRLMDRVGHARHVVALPIQLLAPVRMAFSHGAAGTGGQPVTGGPGHLPLASNAELRPVLAFPCEIGETCRLVEVRAKDPRRPLADVRGNIPAPF